VTVLAERLFGALRSNIARELHVALALEAVGLPQSAHRHLKAAIALEERLIRLSALAETWERAHVAPYTPALSGD
jgi:hypothetical protein